MWDYFDKEATLPGDLFFFVHMKAHSLSQSNLT